MNYSPGFEKFWKLYPGVDRKSGKPQAFRAWTRHNLERHTNDLLALLKAYSESDLWTKESRAFVPMPATWLNRKPWDDTPIPQATQKRLEEHRQRLRAEARQAEHNTLAIKIADAKAVEDQWTPINNGWEDLGVSGQRLAYAAYAKANNNMPPIEKFVKVWWWAHRAEFEPAHP